MSIGAEVKYKTDAEDVLVCYFFLDRFGMPPDVTLRQDEALMGDIMATDKQVNYKKWAQAHGVDEDDDEVDEDDTRTYIPFGPNVKSYQGLF